ncbi:hypothetical protein [Corynebacterium rhinophilum]|uniref:hypothetical protein n=1 Tax=Corynebacterium rhinophilum TaxID=3050197 RepID=UPI00254F8EB8|nr:MULTISPECIES: hypothetical protein [unclassified Corynebacterium]MDK8646596.1 hypothetical protein [Corynebacterium sp. MSK082]MDK8697845.1 hypothetical protein [Corynebacterium sp. MSK192]
MKEKSPWKETVKAVAAVVFILFGLLDIASLALGTTDTPASTALLGIACIIPGAWWFYCTAKDKQHRNWLTVWAIVIVLLIVVIIIEW